MDSFEEQGLIDVGIEACAAELLKNHRGGSPDVMADLAIKESQREQALKSATELRPVFTAIAAMIAKAARDAADREYERACGDDL